MAEVFTQVLQPEPVGDQRWICFDDDQALDVPSWRDLQDQAIAGIRRGADSTHESTIVPATNNSDSAPIFLSRLSRSSPTAACLLMPRGFSATAIGLAAVNSGISMG